MVQTAVSSDLESAEADIVCVDAVSTAVSSDPVYLPYLPDRPSLANYLNFAKI